MNRTNLLIGILSLVFASCANEQPQTDYTGFVDKQIFLVGMDSHYDEKDTIAILSMKIPQRLDTFYKWYHNSCNAAVSDVKYRFADKRYPQFAESGFYWTIEPDSVYQFNIWHKPLQRTVDSIGMSELAIKDSSYYYNMYGSLFNAMGERVLLDQKSFKTINGKNFFVISYRTPFGYLTVKETRNVIAVTNLNDRQLNFIGECSGKDTSNFILNMYKTIESIRIEERIR